MYLYLQSLNFRSYNSGVASGSGNGNNGNTIGHGGGGAASTFSRHSGSSHSNSSSSFNEEWNQVSPQIRSNSSAFTLFTTLSKSYSYVILFVFLVSMCFNLSFFYWYMSVKDNLGLGEKQVWQQQRLPVSISGNMNMNMNSNNYNYNGNSNVIHDDPNDNDDDNHNLNNLQKQQNQKQKQQPALSLTVHRDGLQTERDGITNLIIVACHAVLSDGGDHVLTANQEDYAWYLLDYQLNQDLPSAFFKHIQRGVEEVVEDPYALLIFSGGQTRMQAGPVSEASSYYHVGKSFGWFGLADQSLNDIESRIALEEFAMDSFQNLLFSICRFREVTGNYPNQIKMVSFDFKKGRFLDYHRAALRYPRDHFQYLGVDPDSSSRFNLLKAAKGEKENSIIPYGRDPYGCQDPVLVEKRLERNPFHRAHAYHLSCQELVGLLDYCSSKLYPFSLPWDK